MATLSLGAMSTLLNIPEDFNFVALNNYRSTIRDPAFFEARDVFVLGAELTLQVTGSGFSYILGRLVGGTISSVQVLKGGVLDWSISGLNLNAADFEQRLLVVQNNAATEQLFFESSDSLVGNGAPNVMRGFAGNDVIRPLLGNDTVDGGSGIDTMATGALRLQTTITGNPTGTATLNGPEGIDTLIGVEQVAFADGVLAFSVETTAARVDRLYLATLGREADPLGETNWAGALDAGAITLTQLAAGLANSAEFAQTYGSLSTGEFVDLLYQNVLGRAADGPGRTNWVTAIDQGGLSRANVALGFAESAEFKQATEFTVAEGLFVLDPLALTAFKGYAIALGREPDAPGIAAQLGALRGGLSAKALYEGFTASAEFRATFDPLSNSAKINQLYQHAFQRDADPAGLANLLAPLDAGAVTLADIVVALGASVEFAGVANTLLADGILFA